MSKILVTGGLGYIGSHTVVELINAGFEPVIVDDLSNSQPKILDQIIRITGKKPVFHELDLSDEHAVKNLATAEPDITGVSILPLLKRLGSQFSNH